MNLERKSYEEIAKEIFKNVKLPSDLSKQPMFIVNLSHIEDQELRKKEQSIFLKILLRRYVWKVTSKKAFMGWVNHKEVDFLLSHENESGKSTFIPLTALMLTNCESDSSFENIKEYKIRHTLDKIYCFLYDIVQKINSIKTIRSEEKMKQLKNQHIRKEITDEEFERKVKKMFKHK